MKRMVFGLVVLTGLIAALPAAAQSSVTVIGPGPAQACYEAARTGASGFGNIQQCDDALASFGLSEADRAATFTNRGVLHLQRREAQEALADMDAAIALRADLGATHVNRGAALILLGRSAEAVAAIDQGIALGTDDPHEAYFNRGIAHEELGDLTAAYRDYTQAAALAPEWTLPRTELARFTVQGR